jgi:hypothetical protein
MQWMRRLETARHYWASGIKSDERCCCLHCAGAALLNDRIALIAISGGNVGMDIAPHSSTPADLANSPRTAYLDSVIV